jgi:hypothetical protein
MRKLLALGAALMGLAIAPAVAPASEGTGIKGVVLDTTCYGPCRVPPPPPPRYTGDGLIVTVRSLPDRDLVAKLHPKDGRFRVETPPGTYRVRARIGREPNCWQGEARRVEVRKGDFTRVRLHVYNACIV